MAHLPKCPTCDGQGRVVKIAESTLYDCGFVQVAVVCPDCKGCRILAPKPVSRVRRFLSRLGVA